MSDYAVFFAGSDQDVHSPKHVYTDWARELRQSGYRPIMKSGVGKHTPGIKQPLFCKCRDEQAGHLAFMFR